MTAWANVAVLPAQREAPACTNDDTGRVYAFGGYFQNPRSEAYRFDPSTGAWSTLPSMDTARQGAAAATDSQGRPYVFGGFAASSGLATCARFDPSSGQWSSVASMSTARQAPGGASDAQGRIYAIGGYTTQAINTCERYTPSSNTWAPIAPMPGGARLQMGCAPDPQGRIYAVGGDTGSGYTGRLERYDPASDAWTALPACPGTPRAGGAAWTDAAGRLYYAGGYTNNAGVVTPVANLDRYDPSTNAWTSLTAMSVARGAPGYAKDAQGRMYAIGGQGASGTLASVERNTENTAPNAATPTTPTTGSSVDRTTPITLAWVFNDPDAGDSQSKSDIRYKLTSASTWTTILGATTTATSYALPANQAAGNYEWQVLTYDALGVASPWSSSSFFTAADPPGVPVITAPSSGATIAAASYTVTWSAPNQDAFEVRRVADNAGSPNTGSVYFTTGTVEDATSRARTLTFDTNNRTEHVQVRVRYSGIWSQWATARVLVSYTPPATPTVVLTVQDATASILVTITNPTPSGSQPAVASHDILIDDGLGDGPSRRATGWTPGAPYTYFLARSGWDYAGNIKVVAVATNSTMSTGVAT